MYKRLAALLLSPVLLLAAGCHDRGSQANTVTMLIESSPTNLDPRIGTDAQSEHIYTLIFDSLVRRDDKFNVKPWLAQSWETPDPLTYIFHLRSGVRFQNGQPLTSRDVKYTLDSTRDGSVVSLKASSFATWDHIETPDTLTVVVHLKKADPALLWNVCDGAFGVIPYGSGKTFWQHPIGSGPFEFVSQEQDKEVIVKRSPNYWQTPAKIDGVRFAVVPDAITRALELQKGTADVAMNAVPADMLPALARNPKIRVQSGPGTVIIYTILNLRDPKLKDVRIRTAIAEAINRPQMIQALYGGRARLAESVLPPEHWAWTGDTDHHPFDPAKANALLDAAGYKPGPDGIRLHLTMKTSTDETTRLLAVILQQQLSQIGIALEIRSYEFATFYADVTKGAFQMAPSRWIGANESPDIFRYADATASFPPHGANRGYYSNPAVDAALAQAGASGDRAVQIQAYNAIQKSLAHDLPTINLWYADTVAVRSSRLSPLTLSASGSFDFLRDVSITNPPSQK